jgi:hypothetical protein
VPISYSPRTGQLDQHHHNLRTYKGTRPSTQAQWHLLALLLLFLHEHLDCTATVVGAHPTHVATVPSTRGRPGPHPLATLIGSRLGLPHITSVPNRQYGPGDREFHPDWFTPTLPTAIDPIHALIIDDTWTSGARAQSLAYALKTAGAPTVTTVVLGRHVNPDYPASQPLLEAITTPIFDTTRCIVHP